MNLKDIFKIKNIKSFIEGYSKYYYDKIWGLPEYTQEQILYRLYKCKDDCVPAGRCKDCGCPPEQKGFVTESCNKGERFPDLMGKEDWEEFKIKNNIK